MGASDSELVQRIRYVAMRRPVTRAAVPAVMLVPAFGRDPLLSVDKPIVLALCLAVTGSLLDSYVRLRRARDLTAAAAPRVAEAMGLPVAVSGLALLAVLLAVAVDAPGAATTAIVLEIAAVIAAGVLVARLKPRRDDDQAPPPQPSGYGTAMAGAAPFVGTSIACSGGGIRAAAFCLGGLQRLRQREAGAASLYDRADRVYAVSGGSYIATALHLARRNSPADADVQASLFTPGSPEEDWLRRKSKFLIPTGSTLVTGFLSLMYGIAVNLALVGVTVYAAALYVGWVHNRLDVVCPGRPAGGAATCLADGGTAVFTTRAGSPFLLGWSVLIAGLLLFVVGKTLTKYSGRGRLVLARATRVLVTSGVAVGALLVVLPWLLVALNNATLTNAPSATLAKVMANARLATPDGCLRAIENDLTEQATLTWERAPAPARADPLPFTYRGCGGTWTDDALVFAPGGVVTPRPGGRWCDPATGLPRPRFCDDRPTGGKVSLSDTFASWFAGVVALAAAVRGVAGSARFTSSAPGSRRGMVADLLRRVLLPWAAAAVVSLAVLMVLLVLLRDNLLNPARLHAVHAGVIAALVVLGLRLLTDAMLSSLHPFYRERLSDSFLLRRLDDQAEPLPYRLPTHVHQCGALSGPDLVVCCAANIQDRDYIPAARGCAPFQFRTDTVGSGDAAVPGRIGISDARLPAGRMQPAQAYSATSDPQGLDTTLAAAMAASGAAFSPRVGRMDGRVRPYRMLLALANARLGVWLPNPYLVDPTARVAASAQGWEQRLWWALRRAGRPGPLRIFKEAFGSLSIDDTRIYVTDGGHYDNTAIVEALRDRPRTLFVLDASADLEDSLDALSDAIVTARMDLGLVLRPAADSPVSQVRRDPAAPVTMLTRGTDQVVQRPALPVAAWLHFEVGTVEDPLTVVSDVWFVKNVRTSQPNIEIDGYAAENRTFPVTSTSNQFYGEYDFEAYRLLGYVNTTQMLAAREG